VALLPSPLILLTALRYRAGWRRLVRLLRTPKGILIGGFGAFGLLVWLVPGIIAAFRGRPVVNEIADGVAPFGPFIILGLLLLSLVRSPGEEALAFLQAEVDLLFPAPFTRRQLLFYKLAQRVVPLLFVSLFFSLWTRQFTYGWLQGWLGILLTLWFLHLVGLCVAMLGQVFEKRRFAVWRRLIVLGVFAAVVLVSWWMSRTMPLAGPLLGEGSKPVEMLRTFASSSAGAIVSAPAVPFARVIFARDAWPDLPFWGALAFAINAALLGLAARLDANWLEAGAESSKKLAERLEQYKRTGSASTRGAMFAFVRLPMFPRLGGVGPLAWRQSITGIRQGARGLMIIAIVIAAMIVPQLFREGTDPLHGGTTGTGPGWATAFKPVSFFLLGYISLFMPQLLRLDFRGDTDRMDTLKSLPVSPFAVAAAQVVVPAAIVTLIQLPLGAGLAWLMSWALDAMPAWALVVFAANLLIAAVENAIYLIWPIRPSAGVGMSFVSGQMITQLVKTFSVIMMLALAAGAGGLGAWVSDNNMWVMASAVLVVLTVEVAIVVWLVGRLFARFDPSRDRLADA